EPHEFWPGHVKLPRRAVPDHDLDAIRAVGGRHIPPCWWSKGTVTGRGCRAGAEGFDGVVNDVLRQHVDHVSGVVFSDVERILQLSGRHADQADVAEAEILTALDARRPIEAPAADNTIDHTAAARPFLALPEWQLIHPVEFHRVMNASGVA